MTSWSDNCTAYRNEPCPSGTTVCERVTLTTTQTTCYRAYSSRCVCLCVRSGESGSGGGEWRQIYSRDADIGTRLVCRHLLGPCVHCTGELEYKDKRRIVDIILISLIFFYPFMPGDPCLFHESIFILRGVCYLIYIFIPVYRSS